MTQHHPGVFGGLCAAGILARASHALARTPVPALFAASLGAGPEAIGFAVAISTDPPMGSTTSHVKAKAVSTGWSGAEAGRNGRTASGAGGR